MTNSKYSYKIVNKNSFYSIKNHYSSSLLFLLWDFFSPSSLLIQEGRALVINLSIPPKGLLFNRVCLNSVIFWSLYCKAFSIFYNLKSRRASLFFALGFLSLGLGAILSLRLKSHGTPLILNNFLISAWYRLLIANYYRGFPGMTRAKAFSTFRTQNKRVQVIKL